MIRPLACTRLAARRALVVAALAMSTTGCMMSDDDDEAPDPDAQPGPADADAGPDAGAPAAATATGIISIQDQQLHGAPEAGHGLSVRADFTAVGRPPDFDEMPGQPTGCKAWLHDMQDDPPPAVAGDQGVVSVSGTSAAVPAGCVFNGRDGYFCPVATGSRAETTVTPMEAPAALYDIAGMILSDEDIGRHLRITGDDDRPSNDGAFAIVAVSGPTSALVANPAARAGQFAADYTIVAGAGAAGLPLDSPRDPVRDGDQVVIGIEPGGGGELDFADTAPIEAGDAFTLDAASDAILSALPVDGRAFSIGCSGEGGRCGEAYASIVQLETSDGDTRGISPFALPVPRAKKVIISCATLGESGRVDVPAAAARLLRDADRSSRITRVRVAFMRDGFQLATNPPPLPPNPVRIVVGHQIVGFTDP